MNKNNLVMYMCYSFETIKLIWILYLVFVVPVSIVYFWDLCFILLHGFCQCSSGLKFKTLCKLTR